MMEITNVSPNQFMKARDSKEFLDGKYYYLQMKIIIFVHIS